MITLPPNTEINCYAKGNGRYSVTIQIDDVPTEYVDLLHRQMPWWTPEEDAA